MKEIYFKMILCISTAVLITLTSSPVLAGPLLDYVNVKDNTYSWSVTSSKDINANVRLHSIKFKSQKWQGIEWTHRLNVLEPKKSCSFKFPILFITGSGNGQKEIEVLSKLCSTLNVPVAILHDVPNQPLFGGKEEDAIVAYTFMKYFETGDPTWPLLSPMTKSAIRAMDVLEDFAKERTGEKDLNFLVSGLSKRGWTTWLVAASDKRVKGIVPMVYDNLNLAKQMQHHITAWGDYSFKIKDYTTFDLPSMLASKEGQTLANIIDPYAYLDVITIPKLIVIGTNDPYWPLDALNVYYSDLQGDTYIYYMPNAGHNLGERYDDLIAPIAALYNSLSGKLKLPQLSWEFKEGNSLELIIKSEPAPSKVDFWVAHSPTRDFRSVNWEKFKGDKSGETFSFNLAKPKEGWSAIFARAYFEVQGHTFSFASQVGLISAK